MIQFPLPTSKRSSKKKNNLIRFLNICFEYMHEVKEELISLLKYMTVPIVLAGFSIGQGKATKERKFLRSIYTIIAEEWPTQRFDASSKRCVYI